MRLARLTNGKRSRAAAILLALWALFLLSAMVISWALDINSRLSLSSSANRALEAEAIDRKSTRLNSSHPPESRMPSSA